MNKNRLSLKSFLIFSFLLFAMSFYSQRIRFPYDPTPAEEINRPVIDTSLVRI